MKIMIAHPGHRHSTIDVSIGYVNALRAMGHEVHAYDYHNRLTFYSGAIRFWMKFNPDFKLPDPDEAVLILASEPIAIESIDFVPDVVIIVCGFALHRRAYSLLYSLCLPTVLILTESPYLDEEQSKIIEQGHISLAFANDKSSVLPLREMTTKRIEYLPHSFDPFRHYNQDVNGEYKTDLFFFGTMWPERKRVLTPLKRWLGRWHPEWNANISGTRPMSRKEAKHLIANTELAKFYSGTQIALNHHRTIASIDGEGEEVHVTDPWSLGPRAYEIAACGAFQLCDNTRPELKEVFGDTVATYSDAADLRRKVNYYMAHDDEREDMALEANDLVQDRSFEDRAENILIPCIEEVI